jgi:GTP-binding protein
MKLPRVIIVGRMNVGKSTLFNRLSVNAKSMTFDYEGVTRDFIKDIITWRDHTFELIDTGGISITKSSDEIQEQVRQRALGLLGSAELLLLVCDGTVGMTNEDRDIAKVCRKVGKKIILVVNKSDNKKSQEHEYDFDKLGIKPTISLSALHGSATGDLLDAICDALPAPVDVVEEAEPTCKIVILGKPNVGKSSLMNLLLKEERAIVSPVAGTTREAIAEKITFYKQDLLLTDTPGIRRKRSINQTLETMMVKSSFRAVEHADLILLLIDSSSDAIADQELKLAFYVFEHYKSLIIIFNKDDLSTPGIKQDMDRSLSVYHYFLKKIPQLHISCKDEKNVGKVLPLVKKVYENSCRKIADDELTMLIKEALRKKPLYFNTMVINVLRVRQIAINPVTIVLISHTPEWFGPTQLGFFDNIIRAKYELQGAPIKFLTRKPS